MNIIEKYLEQNKVVFRGDCRIELEDILKAFAKDLVAEIAPDIENHYCRFNDGECVCDCFKEAVDQINKNLDEALK